MRALSARFQERLRSIGAAAVFQAILFQAILFGTMIVVLAGAGAKAAHAAEAPQIVVKTGGKLPVPPTAALGVIATDPILQEILSQDFQVAGRLAGASATSELTLTVTLTHRALEPGMSLNEVAPGDGDAIALLKKIGVNPPPLPEQTAQDKDGESDADDTNAAEGNSHAKSDVNSYEQQGQMQQQSAPMGGSMPLPMTQWPVPPATAQERLPLPPYMQASQRRSPLDEARHEREASAVYDTIFIARATAGTDSTELTVVAVAHPGFDAHEARKLIAEEIANSVLH
jgi:hypothetical protein